MKKTFFKYGFLTLLLFGVLMTAVPFVQSMAPTREAFNNMVHLPVLDMEVGELREYRGMDTHLFVTRLDGEKEFRVSGVPMWYGDYGLPGRTWFPPYFSCTDFGPTEQGVLACLDEDGWLKDLQWSFEGKFIGSDDARGFKVSDIWEVRHWVSSNHILLTGHYEPYTR